MPSNREAYFEALKLNIPKSVIYFALQEVNGFSHLELSEKFDSEIKDYARFIDAMNRYQNGEMIEYIFDKSYFLSKAFYINRNVLIPRQETEELVLLSIEYIKDMFNESSINIADVCTGSGVIGLSVMDKLPSNKYFLSDVSEEAIEVAKQNAKNLNLKNVYFLVGDMLEPFVSNGIKLDVLLCNPPYIEDISTIDKRTFNQEPHLALLANPCTYFYESIFKNYSFVMKEKFLMAFEIGEDMEEKLTILINKYFPNSEHAFKKDIYGKTRFLFIKQQ